MTSIHTFASLVEDVMRAPGPVRIVGIDGCGGAGKSTFAARLSRLAEGAPVIHTDDFASHDEPTEWWPRMHRDVITPLLRNERATFRPYDWVARSWSDPVSVPPAPLIVIEGVGATRRAWRDSLGARIWVDTPREERLRRGIARDGEELREFWRGWMVAEDRYVDAEHPQLHADLVVDGDPSTRHDPEREFVVLSAPRPAGAAAGVRR
jgi:uridine kinase